MFNKYSISQHFFESIYANHTFYVILVNTHSDTCSFIGLDDIYECIDKIKAQKTILIIFPNSHLTSKKFLLLA